jgi:hypothetical protein
MKKQLLLSAVLFVCSFQSFSQDTLANMLEVGNSWFRYKMGGFRSPNDNVSDEIVGDTIIAEKKYFKVLNLMDYLGLIRLSTMNLMRQEKNAFYSVDLKNDSAYVLYYFTGLKVGDSLVNNKKYYRYNYVIDYIDTLIFNKTTMRRFLLKTSETADRLESEVWYFEGVGSEGAGIVFEPSVFFEGQNILNCAHNKYGNFYMKEISTTGQSSSNNTFTLEEVIGNTECKPLVTKTFDNTLSSQITLSKHSENLLQLNTELSLSNAQISIHDMKGSVYKSILQQNNQVDIAALPIGLYILKLQTADDKLVSFKFVK